MCTVSRRFRRTLTRVGESAKPCFEMAAIRSLMRNWRVAVLIGTAKEGASGR
jgi:hypothetical protein